MTTTTSDHWLKKVAYHAGVELDIPIQPDVTEIRQAWPKVVEACRITDERFTQKVAGHFRIGVADVSTYDPQAVKLVPEAVARRHGILPMSATESNIVIATSDPTSSEAARDVIAHASRQPVFLLASPAPLATSLERAYAPARAPRNALQTLVAQVAEIDFEIVAHEEGGLTTSFALEDPAVVRLADLVTQQALRYRATEIHIEPGRDKGRVRYRIDGVLQHVVDLPTTAHNRLVARLKHMASSLPNQADGFTISIQKPAAEKQAHFLTSPTPDGELVWIRLVDPHDVPTIERLNFAGPEAAKIQEILARRDGLVLVTGPARSGTTSFIYATLQALERQSVISLEGRPELIVPGVTQIKYDASAGKTFAETLQGLLDRSPDVIHAGEIRDLATARIVLRTAVTGRKVLATVHTPDAVSGVRRLLDLGLAPGRLGESLHAVVSMRLLRKLCERCSRDYDEHKDARSREAKLAAELGVRPVSRAVGCKVCAGTGYLHQVPIPEVLIVTPALRASLERNPSDAELLRVAQAEGMRTFAEVGLSRVANGETTVEELERVLGIVPTREESPGTVGPILVVDDEPSDRILVGTVLREMGFEVVEANGGPHALEILEESTHDFSLVVMDLLMPDVSGFELLRSIRQTLATHSLPVVVLTHSDNPRDELELLEAGADDFLLKPVVIERLEARVRAVLRRSGVRIAGGIGR